MNSLKMATMLERWVIGDILCCSAGTQRRSGRESRHEGVFPDRHLTHRLGRFPRSASEGLHHPDGAGRRLLNYLSFSALSTLPAFCIISSSKVINSVSNSLATWTTMTSIPRNPVWIARSEASVAAF